MNMMVSNVLLPALPLFDAFCCSTPAASPEQQWMLTQRPATPLSTLQLRGAASGFSADFIGGSRMLGLQLSFELEQVKKFAHRRRLLMLCQSGSSSLQAANLFVKGSRLHVLSMSSQSFVPLQR
jgi:hypothetical protein